MSRHPPASSTADSCLPPWLADQIERDGTFLTSLAEQLQQTRAGLSAGRLDVVQDVLRRQEDMVRLAEQAREQRRQWRADAGVRLRLSVDQISYATVAAALDEPARSALLAARDRVRHQAQLVARLLAANAFLARAYHGALQRFFLDLTGGGSDSGRYGREGSCAAPGFGSILHTEG